jgi:hypothetical protein
MSKPLMPLSSAATIEDVRNEAFSAGFELDRDDAELVQIALSRLLGRTSGERLHALKARSVLAGLSRLARVGDDSSHAELPCLPEAGWPSQDRALKHVGISSEDLDRAWRRAVIVGCEMGACLDVSLVCAFWPPILWPQVAAFIEWGPARSADLLLRWLLEQSERELPATRARRNGGRPTVGTLKVYEAAARALMGVLIDLHTARPRLAAS